MSPPSHLHDALLQGLDQAQCAAVEAPLERALRVLGASGSGKTEVLVRRIVRAVRASGADGVVILAPAEAARRRLSEGARAHGAGELRVEPFEVFAHRLAAAHAAHLGIDPLHAPLTRLEAKRLFEGCVEPLLMLEWPELERGDLDVEVPGLGWPERFRDDAFDLVMKLHDAHVSPEEFLEGARRGAEAFYGRVDLAEPARMQGLTERARSSLLADDATLAAQRAREWALAQVLAHLYRDFLAALERSAATTEGALFGALTALFRAEPSLAHAHRRAHPLCVVDDAHACRAHEAALLRALYGEALSGVTIAGRDAAALETDAAVEVRLTVRYRAPRGVATTLYRAADARGEARFVGSEIAKLASGRGLGLGRIAVIAREQRGLAAVERELAARDTPFQYLGSTSLFDDQVVLDVLALAGCACDARDPIHLLRALQTPVVALADRTLHRLCAPAQPQAPLFDELADVGRGAKRAERREALPRNVIDGAADADLEPAALARLRAFREALARWRDAAATLELDALLARIADESGYLAHLDGLPQAGRRHGRRQLRRLLIQARDFARLRPDASIGDFLAHAAELAARDVALTHDLPLEDDAVAMLAAEEAHGHEFDAVFVVGAHAGSFPRYFSAPSFYFSPRYGVIARENLEDGGGPESAKFAWYCARQRLAERYYAQERSLFDLARARARSLLFVTAYGRATRALRNPELLEELRLGREEGVRDVTQTWEP